MVFLVYSLDVVERNGFSLKVSSNSEDGNILVFVKNDELGYYTFKNFSTPVLAREWCNDLVDSTNITREIVEELMLKK